MDGEDEIEDLSEDAALDKLEEEADVKPAKKQGGGNPLSSLIEGSLGGAFGKIMGEDEDMDGVDDYVVESVDKEGNHMRKEVHKGDGWESVSITNSGGSGSGSFGMGGGGMAGADPFSDPFGGGDLMGDLIAALMME